MIFKSNWLKTFINLLTPRYCMLCSDKTAQPYNLCLGCKADLPWITHHCHGCAIPLNNPDVTRCGPCSAMSKAFTQTICPFRYSSPIDTWIKKLKFNQNFNVGRILAHCLSEAIQKIQPSIDVIIPVPLHTRRWIKRGYNQAHCISKRVSKLLEIPHDTNIVTRTLQTPPQVGLKKKERIKNVKNNFTFKACKYNTVVIIDDVMTTSATVNEIAKGLQNNGAKNVIIGCLSRSSINEELKIHND
jgi:ComF family protein